MTKPTSRLYKNIAARNALGGGAAPLQGALFTLLFLALLAIPAWAQSLSRGLEEAADVLAQGDAAAAVEAYRELQVAHPDAPEVIFGLGCAQYAQAQAKRDAADAEAAAAAFEEAQATFERVTNADDQQVARHAAFNRANCLAQRAKMIPAEQNYEAAVGALRRAADAYQAVLDDYPGYDAAQQNLDHVRYLLKQLLRNPPDKQEQQVTVFTYADTELPNATAEIRDDTTVELKRAPSQGGQP